MALELVTFLVKDDQTPALEMSGVAIRVYDPTGTTLINWGTTGGDGRLSILLEAGDYQVRCYKMGNSFTNPYGIEVVSPPVEPHLFRVQGVTQTLPLATDPLLCRCSAYFVDPSGQPLVGMAITFCSRLLPIPQLLGAGDAARSVLSKRTVYTNSLGYATVDLPRNAEFEVVLGPQEDAPGVCAIPDAPSANLAHILHPQVGDVAYDEDSPLSLTAGDIVEVTLTVTYTSKVQRFVGSAPISFTSSDEDVVAVSYDGGTTLQLTAVAAGVATISPARVDPPVSLPTLADLSSLVVHVS